METKASRRSRALDPGAAYVFGALGGQWAQQAYVKASNTNQNAQYGSAVALSFDGSTLAVGSEYEASDATGVNGDESDISVPGTGAVYVLR